MNNPTLQDNLDCWLLLADFLAHQNDVPASAQQGMTGVAGSDASEGSPRHSRETVCEWLRKEGVL